MAATFKGPHNLIPSQPKGRLLIAAPTKIHVPQLHAKVAEKDPGDAEARQMDED
jgi:hypothetical protein